MVKIDAELIGQRLQPLGEFDVILEAAEFESDRSRSWLGSLPDHPGHRWRVIVAVVMSVERAVTPSRRDDVPIVVVIVGDADSKRIEQLNPDAVSGDTSVVAVLCITDLRRSRQPTNGK